MPKYLTKVCGYQVELDDADYGPDGPWQQQDEKLERFWTSPRQLIVVLGLITIALGLLVTWPAAG